MCGIKDGDFQKPIIAVVNSFTQFVPGHVRLKDLGQRVAREIEAAGGVAKEFNTIAVDDATLAARRQKREEEGWHPAEPRPRKITAALRAYASMTTSAARGAVRSI